MSLGWFGIIDGNRKDQRVTSKKTRLPTEARTKKHKCSQCQRTDAQRVGISDREVRWLCPEHLSRASHVDTKERPNFVRASKLHID